MLGRLFLYLSLEVGSGTYFLVLGSWLVDGRRGPRIRTGIKEDGISFLLRPERLIDAHL